MSDHFWPKFPRLWIFLRILGLPEALALGPSMQTPQRKGLSPPAAMVFMNLKDAACMCLSHQFSTLYWRKTVKKAGRQKLHTKS